MDSTATLGVVIVVVAGLAMGSVAWPMKLMRKFQFEQWFLIMMLVGLVGIPWLLTPALCPDAMAAYRTVPTGTLVKSNMFAFCWGIANILMGICFVRIGAGLTFAILTALGASVGFGIQQPAQIIGAQILAFVSGEWQGVKGVPRRQMYAAIVVLTVAAAIMAAGNVMPKS